MPPLYDLIGSTYPTSRRADPLITKMLAAELALSRRGQYLDLGCGTGNYTIALSGMGGAWSGVDVSEGMLDRARQKSNAVTWTQSGAEALPFPDGCFDGAICTLAIHHFLGLEEPFSEARRTLRAGSFVIFTGLAEQMSRYWLCDYFPEMMARSIDRMPTEAQVRAALLRAGFKSITVTPFWVTNELEDLFLYSGKHRPELYLDPAIRANISSFASLASASELQEGVERLGADLESGAFASVKAGYTDEAGDYAFVTASIQA